MRGLAYPVRCVNGRLALCEGAEQVGKLVLLSMMDGDSANPWNTDVGLNAPTFDLDSPATRAVVEQRIRERFARLEADERARLLSVTFENGEEAGEVAIRVAYVDLETDEELEAVRRIARGAGEG